MTTQDLQTLLDYHYWARDRTLEAVEPLTPEQFTRDLGSSFRSVRDTLVHLLAAETNWYLRWQGTSPTTMLSPDGFADVSSLRAAWRDHETKMRSFVAQLDEAGTQRIYQYKMLNGQAAESAFWQMLQHIANHGSYHRGQVTAMLRQLGAQPPKSLDMIAFYRTTT